MLTVGDKIPDIELLNQDNEWIRLSDFHGKKLVLFAFPMAGTSQCTKQACTYRDMSERFAEYNTQVLGITGNPVGALNKWHKHHNFHYDLLSDTENILLDELGAWGKPLIGGIELPLAVRSYWIIDEEGIIQQAAVGVDAEDSVYELLAFLQQTG